MDVEVIDVEVIEASKRRSVKAIAISHWIFSHLFAKILVTLTSYIGVHRDDCSQLEDCIDALTLSLTD